MLIPCHVDPYKGSKKTTAHDAIFIFEVAIKNQNIPLPPRIGKGPKHNRYQRNL